MMNTRIEPVSALPRHIGIIMDGNGRWAQARGLPRTAGHRAGMESVRRTLDAVEALEAGITHLTLYGFSSENWGRPESEVNELMGLLRLYLQRELKELAGRGVRLRFIGDHARMPADLRSLLRESMAATAQNARLHLTIALSYGSRQEIVRAVRKLMGSGIAAEAVDERAIGAQLDTQDLPDPDLIIRTSGEQRLSNFLLWQAAYAELVFLDVLWPDFAHKDLEAALAEFARRHRRYGVAFGG